MAFLLVTCLPLAVNAATPVRPNLIIVLADDLGYGDLACYGSKDIITPNLDKFAAEGLRLTNCYAAAANCSPARTGMTKVLNFSAGNLVLQGTTATPYWC